MIFFVIKCVTTYKERIRCGFFSFSPTSPEEKNGDSHIASSSVSQIFFSEKVGHWILLPHRGSFVDTLHLKKLMSKKKIEYS